MSYVWGKTAFRVLSSLVLLLALTCLGARPVFAAPDVTIKIDQVIILPSSSSVKLGAISEISGDPRYGMAVANISVTPRDEDGITKDLILHSIQTSGLQGVTISLIMPDKINFSLEDPYSAEIRRQAAWPWKLKITSKDSIEGDILEVARVKPGIEKASVKIRLKDGSVRYKRFDINWIAPTYTAMSSLEYGDVLTLNDIDFKTCTCRREDIAGSPDEFLGKRLKCYLKPGEPIYARDVEPVYLVKKGDKVRFYSKSGAVTIEAIARALDSGALGQIIKVVNLDSRRVVLAKVVGDGVVVAKEGSS